jgi:serine/threonine protein kinase
MGETTFKELEAKRQARRRYDAIRVLHDTKREQLVLARDTQRNDEVMLRRIILSQRQDCWAFEERAQRLLFITHPNLAKVRDYFTDQDGRGVLVMELHQGLTLEEYAGEIQAMLSPRAIVVELANVTLGVARGLAALHHQGLIHGAISPHAIFLNGRDGFPILGSYSLGISPPISLTTTQIVRQPWIAPEVKSAFKLPLDPRSDIYSLGSSLYSVLVGVAPRIAARDEDTTLALASKFNVHVDPDLDMILARMAARNPAKRIGTAAELVRALEQWKASQH